VIRVNENEAKNQLAKLSCKAASKSLLQCFRVRIPVQEEFALLKSAMQELEHDPFKFAGFAFAQLVFSLTDAACRRGEA
jgi:hypothetical protein